MRRRWVCRWGRWIVSTAVHTQVYSLQPGSGSGARSILTGSGVRSMMPESATGAAATESVTVNKISLAQALLGREDTSRQDTAKAMRKRHCMTMECDEDNWVQ
ncbi:hypothetical protein C8R45DRAFT_1046908 [Mycena sanguinolenta]|nr:hypothetical protein C8R45DRAFT_1046908 [Mycena sanguinolenta]